MKIPELFKELKELEQLLEKLRQEFSEADTKRKNLLEDMQNQCPHPEELIETIVVDNTVSRVCLFCKKDNLEE